MEERFEMFTVLISKISRCIKKMKSEEMRDFDLKSPHVSSIYYLYKCGSLTAKELGDMCGEDKGAISRSIEYLESNGYIICDDENKKRYRSPLALTESGKTIGEQIAIKIDKILTIASNGLTEEKRKIMYEGLNLISNNLENLCNKYEGENND